MLNFLGRLMVSVVRRLMVSVGEDVVGEVDDKWKVL
jgi:hypothetical protein